MAVSDPWQAARAVIGDTRVTLGPQASQQWLEQPEHLAMVLARYRAAAALIGDAGSVIEFGCGEAVGARILAKGRLDYWGIDTDDDAVAVAQELHLDAPFHFETASILSHQFNDFAAVVSLDVIEHIPHDSEDAFMDAARRALVRRFPIAPGICVIGTPSANAHHLASPQSKVGHINNYTPDRLQALMQRNFHVVQMLYMQDTSIHLGHPGMAHYIMAVGIGPR